MSLAQRLMQKGRQEGREETRIELALSMLADGVDPRFIARHTRLSFEKVDELARL